QARGVCDVGKSLSIDERNNGDVKVTSQIKIHKITFRSKIHQGQAVVELSSLTRRRVVDEDFSSETPPDSNLDPTVGLALFPSSPSGNGPQLHNINTVPLFSATLSPPGKVKLYPPAWELVTETCRKLRSVMGQLITSL
ncbi:hypothetical protein M9458_007215, partial [Cirrhinus mrigala]